LACPDCGRDRPGYNSSLYTAKMNNDLYMKAEMAEAERKYERAITGG
jgi:hypothetical protein